MDLNYGALAEWLRRGLQNLLCQFNSGRRLHKFLVTYMKSVVVCGSKKFKTDIAQFCKSLNKLGVLVFEPSIQKPILESELIQSSYVTSKVFKGLTLEQFDWIRKSEVCFIYNKNDYVGVSVTLEMAYASALGKPIFALSAKTGDPCRDCLIDKVVKTPLSLTALL